MWSEEGGVMFQWSLIVCDTNAASLIQARDIEMVLVPVGVDDAVSRETCRAAVRVVDDDDILYPE
jgi:hypothetical protein